MGRHPLPGISTGSSWIRSVRGSDCFQSGGTTFATLDDTGNSEDPIYDPEEPSYDPLEEPSYDPLEPSFDSPEEPTYDPPEEPTYYPPTYDPPNYDSYK